MEYPKDPTVLPSAQRHTETYNADQGRVFTDGDVISIQIPPTTNSYLTKDTQLHFDFNMTYQEGTDDNYKEIVGNLTFDNRSVVIVDGSNTLTFTGGQALTSNAIPANTYAGYTDVCEAFNAANPNLPIHLYYDDVYTNKIKLLYGFLIRQNINDKIEISVNGVTYTVILEPEVYAWQEDVNFNGFPIYNFETYLNSKLFNSGVGLTYDATLNIFVFKSQNPFTIKASSNEFMKLLGFPDMPIEDMDRESTLSVTGDYWEVYALTPSAQQSTGIISLAVGALATQLGFTGVTPFAKINDDYLQYVDSAPITFLTPNADYTPAKFFEQLIYTEPTSAATANPKTYPNIYRPYPTLDVNGPYSFFDTIEVYDYLGTTLLETVPRHDLLTAIWSDLESSTETQDTIIRPQYLDDDLLTITKPSCSFLVTGNPNILYNVSPIVTPNPTPTEENVKAATLSIPTLSCGINLYSFLGKLSEKFVPLHNGFTVKFFINRRQNSIAFNTQQPGNVISYIAKSSTGILASCDTTMNPFVKTYTFSNVYLRGDIVTVPPELDSRIDKIVFSKGYKVQAGVPQNRAQRVNTEVKSLTSLMVVQQPSSTHNGSMRQSAFIRNYCPGAKLLFNKAVVSSVRNFTEAYRNFRNVFGCTWDKYVRRSNWEVDFPSSSAAWMQTRMNDKANLSSLSDTDKFFDDVPVALGRLPRYLLAFDTRLPGYTPMAVCGIDTRKQLLEIQLETTTNTTQSAIVTVISEFDTFIEIKPSESSAVSF